LRITTHLDDEDNLKASIGDLVHHINTTPDKVGTVYGIACSIFHCAIVQADKDELGTSFAHTPALQFLPSFYARTMFTPGIEALSRLGCQASGVELLNAISDANNLPRFTHQESLVTDPVAAKVPAEVWIRIGGFITSQADLVTLASISAQAMSAAADLTRFPLVDVIASGQVPPIPETTESTDEEDIRRYFKVLGRAKFTAVRGGRRINVELGAAKWSYYELEDLITETKLYILELDDDHKGDAWNRRYI
jgi:hypothetical protein